MNYKDQRFFSVKMPKSRVICTFVFFFFFLSNKILMMKKFVFPLNTIGYNRQKLMTLRPICKEKKTL